jgi:hypothetical protein
MSRLQDKLTKFASQCGIRGKGPLCVVLVITRKASEGKPPYSANDFLTGQGGQVAGLGRAAVQAILAEHGITRVLAEEGGRTSRGSINRMRAYVDFLNGLAADEILDFNAIERWWIGRVREFFASQPFRLKVDSSRSLRSIVSDLIGAAFARQRECPGTMAAGAVLQHLVGAKLELALPEAGILHNGFAVADAPGDRKGDFLIGDTAIHVTTAPSEALIRKCCTNLAENLRPLIITTENGAGGAVALAKNADVADRIDILEVEQFVATNIFEWSGFQQAQRPVSVRELIDCYNRIISKCETDPSLKISVG